MRIKPEYMAALMTAPSARLTAPPANIDSAPPPADSEMPYRNNTISDPSRNTATLTTMASASSERRPLLVAPQRLHFLRDVAAFARHPDIVAGQHADGDGHDGGVKHFLPSAFHQVGNCIGEDRDQASPGDAAQHAAADP